MLKVCEIFRSIQGESTFAGEICAFVRLSGCDLQCSWCDTGYARDEGEEWSISEIVDSVRGLNAQLVEVTGGEPLMQEETPQLCRELLDSGYTVLVETNGAHDISCLPSECVRIVDVKCPGSGMSNSFDRQNLLHLKSTDQVKFVIATEQDFRWAVEFVKVHDLCSRCPVIFSPVMSTLSPQTLAELILTENLPIRLGIQLHKIIWGDRRGV